MSCWDRVSQTSPRIRLRVTPTSPRCKQALAREGDEDASVTFHQGGADKRGGSSARNELADQDVEALAAVAGPGMTPEGDGHADTTARSGTSTGQQAPWFVVRLGSFRRLPITRSHPDRAIGIRQSRALLQQLI